MVEPYLRLKRDFPDVHFAVGERWMTRWDCREWFERQAIDVCQVDISHTGGLSELMKIAHFAEVYGILMAPHNPYGPVSLAANAHAALCMPNFLILEHCRHRPWFDQVQEFGPTVRNGHVETVHSFTNDQNLIDNFHNQKHPLSGLISLRANLLATQTTVSMIAMW